jgi:hypothetical protein
MWGVALIVIAIFTRSFRPGSDAFSRWGWTVPLALGAWLIEQFALAAGGYDFRNQIFPTISGGLD